MKYTFKSVNNKTVSQNTIKKYIGYFEDSFLLSSAYRYDIKGKRYYIQSALALPDDAKKEQEQRSLLLTQDGFKKIIITKDAIVPLYNEDGVLVMGLFDFLLNESSLEI